MTEEDNAAASYDPSKDEIVKKIMDPGNDGTAGSMQRHFPRHNVLIDDGGLVNPSINIPRPMVG